MRLQELTPRRTDVLDRGSVPIGMATLLFALGVAREPGNDPKPTSSLQLQSARVPNHRLGRESEVRPQRRRIRGRAVWLREGQGVHAKVLEVGVGQGDWSTVLPELGNPCHFFFFSLCASPTEYNAETATKTHHHGPHPFPSLLPFPDSISSFPIFTGRPARTKYSVLTAS